MRQPGLLEIKENNEKRTSSSPWWISKRSRKILTLFVLVNLTPAHHQTNICCRKALGLVSPAHCPWPWKWTLTKLIHFPFAGGELSSIVYRGLLAAWIIKQYQERRSYHIVPATAAECSFTWAEVLEAVLDIILDQILCARN